MKVNQREEVTINSYDTSLVIKIIARKKIEVSNDIQLILLVKSLKTLCEINTRIGIMTKNKALSSTLFCSIGRYKIVYRERNQSYFKTIVTISVTVQFNLNVSFYL